VLKDIKDRKLFERVSHLLFGEKLARLRRRDRHCGNLSYFQETFQNLLSDADFDAFDFDSSYGTRLSDIQDRYAEAAKTGMDPEMTKDTDLDRTTFAHRSEIYTGNWKPHSFKVIVLAATVIFCLVIAVCLCESVPQVTLE
jgi:hypothetical protein